ncbi:DUF2790 domain-containing protein [Pseudomonas sp. PDM14]|uniref:DUF2790 domain-containing protein n=1 Tax=Pseudomonas sp. PDM14 TaxID=2769288 RepID=UPI001786D4D3|nr:DUF2790 domain-containing protein [Pseudomonas sp. PDM14]MBD9483748.1 DUF2790 domain-containing protein [Pseudomonas sp. PDM14]
MKSIRSFIIFFTFVASQGAYAYSTDASEKSVNEIEARSLQAVQRYAEQMGKAVPQPIDYSYGMKLDVAKVIYMTPAVKHCGNVGKLMTYEDSNGELYTIRYLAQGYCQNTK